MVKRRSKSKSKSTSTSKKCERVLNAIGNLYSINFILDEYSKIFMMKRAGKRYHPLRDIPELDVELLDDYRVIVDQSVETIMKSGIAIPSSVQQMMQDVVFDINNT
jgi:hypothetical protein